MDRPHDAGAAPTDDFASRDTIADAPDCSTAKDEIREAMRAIAPGGDPMAGAMAAVQARLFPAEAPSRVGRYMLVNELGRGGMGVVHRAFDPELNRAVAIKLVRAAGGAAGASRLKHEAQTLASLSHRNVVSVFDVGTEQRGDASFVYIVMELIEGVGLHEWLDEHAGETDAIVSMFAAAARGLAAAHEQGIVHRDFKPANVVIDRRGDARVLDFGLACVARSTRTDDTSPDGTADEGLAGGLVEGTLPYMAPEQLMGQPIDARADQYALSVALYRALSGSFPFVSRPSAEMLVAKQVGRVEPGKGPIPRHLLAAITRGLRPEREQRFESVKAWIAAIQDDPAARHRRWGFGVAAGCAIVLGVGGVQLRERHRVEQCLALGEDLSGWPTSTRDAVRTALVAAAPGYGANVAAAVDNEVRRALHSVATVRAQTCQAEVVGTLSAAGAAARYRCTERIEAEVSAFVEVLREGVVGVSGGELVITSDAATCMRDDHLLVAPARHARAFGRLNALLQLGRYDDALALIEAESAGLTPAEFATRVRLELMRVKLLRHRGEGTRAAEVAFDALALADAHGLGVLGTYAMARLADALVASAGDDPMRRVEAGRWLKLARARADASPTPAWLGDFLLAERVDFLAAGQDPLAVPTARELLTLRQQRLGDEHPSTATAHDALGAALLAVERREEALVEFELALALRLRLFGDGHPAVSRSMNNVAIAYPTPERAHDAIALLLRALEGDEESGEVATIYWAQRVANLMTFARGASQCDTAIDWGFEAAEATGLPEFAMANIEFQLGLALRECGDRVGAATHLQTAADLMANDAGAHGSFVARVDTAIASGSGAPLRK